MADPHMAGQTLTCIASVGPRRAQSRGYPQNQPDDHRGHEPEAGTPSLLDPARTRHGAGRVLRLCCEGERQGQAGDRRGWPGNPPGRETRLTRPLRKQTPKDLPLQLLASAAPLEASLVIASFGDSTPYRAPAFHLTVTPDDATPLNTPPAPARYTAQPEIVHQFKPDPTSPPKIVSLVFTLAVLATVPLLLAAWAFLGGNVEDVGHALQEKPIAHSLFLGSVVAMEAVFALYYLRWNLFQTLPVVGVVGAVAFVSGSRALGEVRARRERGER